MTMTVVIVILDIHRKTLYDIIDLTVRKGYFEDIIFPFCPRHTPYTDQVPTDRL